MHPLTPPGSPLGPRAKTVVVASEKGGVGKTTAVVNLGHALALENHNTLIIDADPRGDTSPALGLPTAPGVYEHLIKERPIASQVIPTRYPHLTILRGDQTTRRAASLLYGEIEAAEKPSTFIPATWRAIAAQEPIDFLLIDTPPNGGFWPEQNYRAADVLIITTTLDNIDKNAAITTARKIAALGIAAPVYILPTIFVAGESVDDANLADLRQTFADHVLPPIPRAAAIKQARAFGRTIHDYRSKSAAAQIYRQIARQLINLYSQRGNHA